MYAKFQEDLFSSNEIKSIFALHFFANDLYRFADKADFCCDELGSRSYATESMC